jgi:nitrogen regulatory protein PII
MKETQADERAGPRADPAPLRILTAFIRTSTQERVLQRLRDLGVSNIAVTRAKTYGEDKNFFASDPSGEQVRLDTVLSATRADEIAGAIVAVARTGAPGDGIVIVQPAESLYLVRTGERTTTGAFHT